MGRIVEILIALNALGGIATFLGIKFATRKTLSKLGIGEEDDRPAPSPPPPPEQYIAPPKKKHWARRLTQ